MNKRDKKSPEDGMEWGNGRGVWAEREGQRIKKGDAAAETTLRMENSSRVLALREEISENWNPIDELLQ